MITKASTLADVCFAVSNALQVSGMSAVLTGGSAAAIYAPQKYMSLDADFILDADDPLDAVAVAMRAVGFHRDGGSRMFLHPECQFTVDFPKGPLSVGSEYVRETTLIELGGRRIRVLTRNDCVRDRLAHFYFWDDFTALNAAVAVAAQQPSEIDMAAIRAWTKREGLPLLKKFAEFERRLGAES